jgi:hypothetical protein
VAEEEDWVAKNGRHLKKHGVLGKTAGGSSMFASYLPMIVMVWLFRFDLCRWWCGGVGSFVAQGEGR